MPSAGSRDWLRRRIVRTRPALRVSRGHSSSACKLSYTSVFLCCLKIEEPEIMYRRSFLKGASVTAFTTLANTAQTPPRDLRIAYGAIGTECPPHIRLRTRTDRFTILRHAELPSPPRSRFLK